MKETIKQSQENSKINMLSRLKNDVEEMRKNKKVII